ncbi:hypothetical protein G210_1342 [Candida maltosa Xu316]|uniref:K Homology domain-containing protein n=1 Tax=Candida maltosa (strain Xu316) TaxID=1245528 RepID=M3JYT8_CANMX|nr:hypothetical protein G210_1342 [Candida maltosa Xu316]
MDSFIHQEVFYLLIGKSDISIAPKIIVSTTELSGLLKNLQFTVSTSEDYTLKCHKNLHYCHWELTITSAIILDQLIKSQKQITITGSILDSIRLNGVFNHGFITFCPTDNTISNLIGMQPHESINITPIESIANIKVIHKTKPVTTQTTTVTLKFTPYQVSSILGKHGDTLNSIRFQSKCWIHILPSPVIGKFQQIQITGNKQNIQIAVYEMNKIALECRVN